jgi:hypothetical protein
VFVGNRIPFGQGGQMRAAALCEGNIKGIGWPTPRKEGPRPSASAMGKM